MRFVQPDETEKIVLNGSDEWIRVKKELTIADQIALDTAGFSRDGDGKIGVDFKANILARVLIYLVDWSEKRDIGDEGRKRRAIESLAPEDFTRIDAAIRAHVEAMQQEKKQTTGGPTTTEPSA
jgi:hypothetical protein